MSFRAILISKTDAGQKAELTRLEESDLMEGDVTVDVTHSSVNYKDGLNITGKAPIARRFPMIPGIDFAGVVERSTSPAFKPGDKVLLTGYGVGEGHLGGFAQKARVKSDWLVPLPQGLSASEAMAIGTAGYTAMLCVMALERQGVTANALLEIYYDSAQVHARAQRAACVRDTSTRTGFSARCSGAGPSGLTRCSRSARKARPTGCAPPRMRGVLQATYLKR